MTELLLFTKDDCEKCEKLKEIIEKEGLILQMKIHNVDTVKGMAVASFHEVLKEKFPGMIHGDKHIFGSYIDILRHLRTLG